MHIYQKPNRSHCKAWASAHVVKSGTILDESEDVLQGWGHESAVVVSLASTRASHSEDSIRLVPKPEPAPRRGLPVSSPAHTPPTLPPPKADRQTDWQAKEQPLLWPLTAQEPWAGESSLPLPQGFLALGLQCPPNTHLSTGSLNPSSCGSLCHLGLS